MDSSPLAGQSVLHYRILEKIGAGGMGDVWKALDTKLDRQVALKLLKPDQLGDLAQQRRLFREARSASALNHPNIVTIYDINEDRGIHFLAMEYIQGVNLRELRARGKPSVLQVAEYMIQVSEALSKAHAAGIR